MREKGCFPPKLNPTKSVSCSKLVSNGHYLRHGSSAVYDRRHAPQIWFGVGRRCFGVFTEVSELFGNQPLQFGLYTALEFALNVQMYALDLNYLHCT